MCPRTKRRVPQTVWLTQVILDRMQEVSNLWIKVRAKRLGLRKSVGHIASQATIRCYEKVCDELEKEAKELLESV